MSDTPRTDKVELRRISMECGEPPPNTGDYADLYAEAVEGLRDAECELAAALAERSEVEAERDALKVRLEIDPAHPYDGIDCRDQTIKLLEGRVDALKEDAARWNLFCVLWAISTEMSVKQDGDGRWAIYQVEDVEGDIFGPLIGDTPDAALDAARKK